MSTNQPIWKLVGQLGDRHPLDHGGYFIFTDETGVYPPEAELIIPPEADSGDSTAENYEVRRFILEPCTFTDGILSDNKFHPLHPAWFAEGLKGVADFIGSSVDQMALDFIDSNPLVSAHAWQAVGDYHGFDNLDSYPLMLTRQECQERIASHGSCDGWHNTLCAKGGAQSVETKNV